MGAEVDNTCLFPLPVAVRRADPGVMREDEQALLLSGFRTLGFVPCLDSTVELALVEGAQVNLPKSKSEGQLVGSA